MARVSWPGYLAKSAFAITFGEDSAINVEFHYNVAKKILIDKKKTGTLLNLVWKSMQYDQHSSK